MGPHGDHGPVNKSGDLAGPLVCSMSDNGRRAKKWDYSEGYEIMIPQQLISSPKIPDSHAETCCLPSC